MKKIMSNYSVIDVSKHNGNLSSTFWNNIKTNNAVSAVIIRIGYRGYGSTGTLVEDPKFKQNATNAKAANFKMGVYFLSQAISIKEAEAEVDYIISILNKYSVKLDMPIFVDSEWSNNDHTGRADGLSKADRTNISIAWMKRVTSKGYKTGIYASTSWFNDKLDNSKLSSYDHWVADYRNKCYYTDTNIVGWQKSDSFKISGYSGSLDLSVFYKDYTNEKTATVTETTTKKETVKETTKKTSSSNTKKIAAAQKFDNKFSKWFTTIGDVWVRSKPDLIDPSTEIGVAKKGSQVRCYGYYTPSKGINWYLCVADVGTGYISGKYLK